MLAGPRVTRLWRGAVASDLSYLFLTVILVVVVGLPLSCVIAISTRALLGGALAAPAGMVSLVCLIVASMVLVEKIRPRKMESWNRFRLERLKWMMERPDVLSRVPHRFVEFQHHVHSRISRDMLRQLSKIRSGESVLIDNLKADRLPIPESYSAFEPIEWKESESLISLTMAETGVGGAKVNSPRAGSGTFLNRPIKGFNSGVGWMVVIAISVSSLVRASMRGQSALAALNWTHLLLAIIAISTIYAAYQYLVIGRQFYLVPGGLVRLENGLRFRTPRIALLTPDNTSLVMYREGGVYLITEGNATLVAAESAMIQALIIAWTSRARRPTVEQLRLLLAPDTPHAASSTDSGKSA